MKGKGRRWGRGEGGGRGRGVVRKEEERREGRKNGGDEGPEDPTLTLRKNRKKKVIAMGQTAWCLLFQSFLTQSLIQVWSTYEQSPCTNEETESYSCTYRNSHLGLTYGLDSLNHLGLIPNRFMSWDQMVKM